MSYFRPGMFARVEVLLPEEQHVLVIPATSVFSAPYGDSVYVIESTQTKDDKAAHGGATALYPDGPRARRFCERGIRPEGRASGRRAPESSSCAMGWP